MVEPRGTKSLSPERTAAARRFVQELIDGQFGGNVKATADATGVTYSLLNEFYRGKAGLGNKSLERIADFTGASMDEVTGRTARGSQRIPSIGVDRSDAEPPPPDEEDQPLDRLVMQVGLQHDYKTADIEAARAVARNAHRWLREGTDLAEIARAYLNAARELRTEGSRSDVASVAVRASILLSSAPRAQIEATSRDENERARRDLVALDRGEGAHGHTEAAKKKPRSK
jgi:hypothetical protein